MNTTQVILRATDAISRLDDGQATQADRLIAEVFDRHSEASAYHLAQRLDVLPADVCPCSQPKDPAEPTCLSCYLEHDDAMRRASDV
ncbi:hypothetical protein [Paractinoplanes maris]|uniref:hypothetical protein n=1 Tax=Paractinoplanes maris TaxID=1734446 RepID=UPI0020204688|nr:hypothetical protein [Actinoplanes maris]